VLGGAVGCAAGVASYYADGSPSTQCLVWALAGIGIAKTNGVSAFRAKQAGVAGCLTGAISVKQATVAYAGGSTGKEYSMAVCCVRQLWRGLQLWW